MREILFRAKQVNNGEWAEGYLFDDGMAEVEHYFVGRIVVEPYKGTACDDWDITGIDFCEVNPETLCQYTGLKDKNGNRIWENDIISVNTYDYMEPQEDFFGRVVYLEKWACWCIQLPDEEKFIPLCECEGSYQTDRFVEGNVFDNPELWEQGTEDSHGE